MQELIALGLREFDPVEISRTFDCPFCDAESKKLVGFYRSLVYPMAVFECQSCFEKFMHHLYPKGSQNINGEFVKSAKRRLKIEKLK